MRIVFLTENFPPETNAAATRVAERARYWARWGHDVTVITCWPNFPFGKIFDGYKNRWYGVEEIDGIKVVRLKTFIAANEGFLKRSLDFLSFGAMALIAGIFRARPDVFVATSPQFFAAVSGWLCGFIRRRPFVFELGDIWPASIVAVGAMKRSAAIDWMEKLELFLYRRSEAIVALSPAFRDNLESRGIPPSKIATVINGVELDTYAPQPRDPELASEFGTADRFVVGYVGTHGMAHGLDNVLDTAERLKHVEDLVFLLVGAGAERSRLIDDAARRGLDNVIFGEPQPKSRMTDVWSQCDVALVHLRDTPVFAEVIPSKMFEAMAMGLPILLAAPQGSASDILLADDAGLHVPAEDPESLAKAVMSLRDDETLRNRLAQRALAAAPGHSRETQAQKMMAVLDLAAAGKGDIAGVDREWDTEQYGVARPVRVLINAIHARAGGGLTYLRGILPPLAADPRLDVHLCLQRDQDVSDIQVPESIAVHRVNGLHGFFGRLISEQVLVPLLARRIDADTTLSPANYGPLLTRRPVIMLRNTLDVEKTEPRLAKRVYWWGLRAATALSLATGRAAIAVSSYAGNALGGNGKRTKDRITVVHHGVSNAFHAPPADAERENFLLAVADSYIQKNLIGLVEAFARIAPHHPDIDLRIAGRPVDADYHATLLKRIEQLGLSDRIVHMGPQDTSDLAQLYRTCRAFVFPSFAETFGNPLVEAMRSGAVIACSNATAMPEIAGEAAIYFNSADPIDMAAKLDQILTDEALRARLAKASIARAGTFSWEKAAQQTADVLIDASGLGPRKVVAT